jgi:hypothetical protein
MSETLLLVEQEGKAGKETQLIFHEVIQFSPPRTWFRIVDSEKDEIEIKSDEMKFLHAAKVGARGDRVLSQEVGQEL